MNAAIKEAVYEQSKGLALRGASEVAQRMIGKFIAVDAPASSTPSLPTFSVGATGFIALTAAGFGALAGWALCEMKDKRRTKR
jgi:hypothetical protein